MTASLLDHSFLLLGAYLVLSWTVGVAAFAISPVRGKSLFAAIAIGYAVANLLVVSILFSVAFSPAGNGFWLVGGLLIGFALFRIELASIGDGTRIVVPARFVVTPAWLLAGVLAASAEEIVWRWAPLLHHTGGRPTLLISLGVGTLGFGLVHAFAGGRAVAWKTAQGAVWALLTLASRCYVPAAASHAAFNVAVWRCNWSLAKTEERVVSAAAA